MKTTCLSFFNLTLNVTMPVGRHSWTAVENVPFVVAMYSTPRYYNRTELMPKPYNPYLKTVISTITTAMMNKPQSTTRMAHFMKDLEYHVGLTVIVLWKWKLDLRSFQEITALVQIEDSGLTLRLQHLRVYQP